MIQKNLLKGKMVEKGFTTRKMASELGITPQTFYSKMRKGVFNSDEMYKMVQLLGIVNPIEIFFANEVSDTDTYNRKEEP